MTIKIYLADLQNPFDAQAMVQTLATYHESLMGSQAPLPERVRESVVQGLMACANHRVFLAVNESENGVGSAVGMAVCFVNFSTFRAMPLINVHDLAVSPDYQGIGIGRQLLERVIDYAREQGHCAVTLEVRRDNANALKLYRRLGFCGIEEEAGNEAMLFGKLVL